MKIIASLKGGLQLAGIDNKGIHSLSSAFSLQVAGPVDYEELVKTINDLVLLAEQSENYHSAITVFCGSTSCRFTFRLFAGNISATLNNCRVLHTGWYGCWKQIAKAITKEINKESKREELFKEL